MNGRVFLQVGGFPDFPCPPQKRRQPGGSSIFKILSIISIIRIYSDLYLDFDIL